MFYTKEDYWLIKEKGRLIFANILMQRFLKSLFVDFLQSFMVYFFAD